MTKYFRTHPDKFAQLPPGKPVKDPPRPVDSDKPRKDPQPSDADKPVVDPQPFDPDPSEDAVVDSADEPVLQA